MHDLEFEVKGQGMKRCKFRMQIPTQQLGFTALFCSHHDTRHRMVLDRQTNKQLQSAHYKTYRLYLYRNNWILIGSISFTYKSSIYLQMPYWQTASMESAVIQMTNLNPTTIHEYICRHDASANINMDKTHYYTCRCLVDTSWYSNESNQNHICWWLLRHQQLW